MAPLRGRQYGCSHNLSSRKVRLRHCRNGDAARTCKARKLVVIVAFRVRSAPLVTQSKVQSEAACNLPVILKVKSSLPGLVGYVRPRHQCTAAPAHQHGCEAVSLHRIRAEDALHRDVRTERKRAAGVVRLEKVV